MCICIFRSESNVWYSRVYPDDESSTGSVDQDDMCAPPHIYHCCISQSYEVDRLAAGFILHPGDVVYYFNSCIHDEGFNPDVDKDTFGIVHSYLIGKCTGYYRDDGTFGYAIKMSNCDPLSDGKLVKVYRKIDGDFKSIIPDTDEPWKGWFHLEVLEFDMPGEEATITMDMRAQSDSFTEHTFMPQYSRFVKRLRGRNRRYREHLNIDGEEFELDEIEDMSTYALADVVAFIGAPNEFEEYETRNLSTLYHLVRGMIGSFVETS